MLYLEEQFAATLPYKADTVLRLVTSQETEGCPIHLSFVTDL